MGKQLIMIELKIVPVASLWFEIGFKFLKIGFHKQVILHKITKQPFGFDL